MTEPALPITKPPPDPARPKLQTAPLTGYVLLSLTGYDQWKVEKTVEARSADAAIRQWFTGDLEAIAVVAVPERSWKPVKVTPKTTTTLVIEELP